MVLKGEDWLVLTTEETLEPDIPICDPHHHFWVSRPEPPAYPGLPPLVTQPHMGRLHHLKIGEPLDDTSVRYEEALH